MLERVHVDVLGWFTRAHIHKRRECALVLEAEVHAAQPTDSLVSLCSLWP
jgi:hypothetical protein